MSTPLPVEADPKRPWKALVPVALAVLYAVIEGAQIAFSDNEWSTNDTFTVALLALSALGTYTVRNPLKPITQGHSAGRHLRDETGRVNEVELMAAFSIGLILGALMAYVLIVLI